MSLPVDAAIIQFTQILFSHAPAGPVGRESVIQRPRTQAPSTSLFYPASSEQQIQRPRLLLTLAASRQAPVLHRSSRSRTRKQRGNTGRPRPVWTLDPPVRHSAPHLRPERAALPRPASPSSAVRASAPPRSASGRPPRAQAVAACWLAAVRQAA